MSYKFVNVLVEVFDFEIEKINPHLINATTISFGYKVNPRSYPPGRVSYTHSKNRVYADILMPVIKPLNKYYPAISWLPIETKTGIEIFIASFHLLETRISHPDIIPLGADHLASDIRELYIDSLNSK